MAHVKLQRTVFVVGILVGIGTADSARSDADKEKKEMPVRALMQKADPSSLPMGGTEVIVFADAKELVKGLEERIKYKFDKVFVEVTPAERKAIAERIAKELGGQVDFTKEQVAWVRWTAVGPPEGVLQHEMKEKDVVFYVQAPAANVRGQRARNANDFFAVPAKVKVKMEAGERPAK